MTRTTYLDFNLKKKNLISHLTFEFWKAIQCYYSNS